MGVIKPTNSPYNSLIFVVPKKDGSPLYVLDLNKLNSISHTDNYSMKFVEECALSSGFWQLPLDPESQKFTAFTV
jgi:hypothetical protein